MIPPMHVGSTIRALRKAKGLTLDQVAHAAGTDSGNLSRIERSRQEPSVQVLSSIATALGVTVTELISPDVLHSSGRLSDNAVGTVIRRDAFPGRVPLVTWTKLGEWHELTDPNLPNLKWFPTYKEVPFGQGAAAALSGDSMTQEATPSFPEGTILIIENKPATPGDFVVAKLPSGERTFKKLVEDAGIRYLQPLNPRYPLMKFEGDILGVLIEASTRMRFA